jgi:hypothetical protein
MWMHALFLNSQIADGINRQKIKWNHTIDQKDKKRKERLIHKFILDVESMYKIEQNVTLEYLLCWEP